MILPNEMHVFIVDDDDDDRFMLEMVFKQLFTNCKLSFYGHGEALIVALEKIAVLPQLVLLDINMPVLGGLEALEQLRKQARYQKMPVVMWTTSNQERDKQQAAHLGANAFVTKPNTLECYNKQVLQLAHQWLGL